MNILTKNAISILTLVVPISLIGVAYFWVSTLLNDHHKQHLQFKYDLQLEALSQYKNIKSLVYWGVESNQETTQKYSKHFDPTKMMTESMFGADFLQEKNRKGTNYFRLTSLQPLNPKNLADNFEHKGLSLLQKNAQEIFYEDFNHNQYNFIGRLDTEKSCLSCHSKQGYKIGDLRGGIRISIPLKDYQMKMSSLDEELNKELFFVAMMLFISFLSVYIFQRILKQKNKEIASVNNNLEELVYKRNKTLTTTLDQTIAAFVELVESRDTYTAGHSRRVQYYSNLIASYMNLDSDTVERIDNAALVHDIGKIHTPDAVLLKPGHLTSEEYHLIQLHAESGYSTLINIDEYKHLAYIVKTHHERWDGNGYPSGISGENIPLEARIIAVADTFDAMTTNRIYKPRMNVQEALNEIQRLSNKDFDPNVVNAAMAILGKIKLDNTSQLPINVNDEERMAYHFKDKLTGLYNREYLILLIEKGFNARKFECINIVCLKKFHQYNKNCGWSNGNEILIEFAKQLKKRFSESYLFRIHGDDFVILNFTHFELSVNELDTCMLFENTPIELETRHFDLRQGVDRTSIEEILGNG